jgi:hypothetical protein
MTPRIVLEALPITENRCQDMQIHMKMFEGQFADNKQIEFLASQETTDGLIKMSASSIFAIYPLQRLEVFPLFDELFPSRKEQHRSYCPTETTTCVLFPARNETVNLDQAFAEEYKMCAFLTPMP